MASPSGSRPWSTLRVLLIVIQAALIPLSATAADFYVNPATGSNGNNGLTPGTAWKTITFGLIQVPAGATLNLAAGVYDTTGGEVFPLDIQRPISIRGQGTTKTIIANHNEVECITSFETPGVVLIEFCSIIGGSRGVYCSLSAPPDSLVINRAVILGQSSQSVLCLGGNPSFSDVIATNCRSVGFWCFSDQNLGVGNASFNRCLSLGNLGPGFTVEDGGAPYNYSIKNCLSAGNLVGLSVAGAIGNLSNSIIDGNEFGVFLNSSFQIRSGILRDGPNLLRSNFIVPLWEG